MEQGEQEHRRRRKPDEEAATREQEFEKVVAESAEETRRLHLQLEVKGLELRHLKTKLDNTPDPEQLQAELENLKLQINFKAAASAER